MSTLQRNSTLSKSDMTNWKGSSNNENTGSLNRSWSRNDEEHGLIARYAAKLADDNISTSQLDVGSSAHQLLAQLENKNQEILRQIARIRYTQFPYHWIAIFKHALPSINSYSRNYLIFSKHS